MVRSDNNEIPAIQTQSGLHPQPVARVARLRRRRRAGESFGGCLFMIALVLGGSIWGYFKFFQNRALIQAGHNHNVDKNHNREAELAYMHKLRDTHFGNMARIRGDLSVFFNDVTVKKKYTMNDSGSFDQRYTELVGELRDHVEEFDQLLVPELMNNAHAKISHSHKTYYESLLLLKKGFYEEKDDQKRDYKEARKTFAAAWKEDLDGEAAAHAILDSGAMNR